MYGTPQRRSRGASMTLSLLLLIAAITATQLVTMAAPAAAAVTINVVAGGSIQNAIAAANHGDTIRVYPGVYAENLDFLGKAITVTAVSGPSQTTIDGRARGPVVRFTRNEPRAARLSGFTIKAGVDPFVGGGVQIANASPTISANVITDNHACSGSGISAEFSSALLERNTIQGNTQQGCTGGAGGGIYVGGAGAVEIRSNSVTGNRADSGGGIERFAAGAPVVADNRIIANKATAFDGGGIEMVNLSDAAITQNVISGNAANFGRGGGVAWLVPQGARGPALVNNTFAGNNAALGQAVFADGFQAAATLTNNVVVAGNGAALVCGNFGAQVPAFRSNDVWSPNAGWHLSCGAVNNRNGNRSQNPMFVNLAGGDLHLAAGSPLVDRGAAIGGLPATDLDGRARVRDGDNDGVAVVDLGAYER